MWVNDLQKDIKDSFKRTQKAIDYAAILAIVIPILIDLATKYLIPFLINTVIPWIIDQLKKKNPAVVNLVKAFKTIPTDVDDAA